MTAPRVTGLPLPIAVLISGEGTNLQAILDLAAAGLLPARVRIVISSRANAPGLRRASVAGIPARVIPPKAYADREKYEHELAEAIESHAPRLVLLAGFMHVLGKSFVQHYRGRLVNIHPSLLPHYPGLRTHRQVLASGDRETGCSVHFVTEELDRGPVIAQARVPVRPGDTEQQLAARVQRREHDLYPLVIRWLAEGRVHLEVNHVSFDGKRLTQPLTFASHEECA